MGRYTMSRDGAGHWLVAFGPTEKPVATFYAHNVPDYVARRRAERFIKAMTPPAPCGVMRDGE